MEVTVMYFETFNVVKEINRTILKKLRIRRANVLNTSHYIPRGSTINFFLVIICLFQGFLYLSFSPKYKYL